FLGERYRDLNHLIWILGGDRKPTGYEETWRAMARGIAEGTCGREDYSQTVMTYHPWGGASSADWFHEEPWLTFHMIQSGHHADSRPWEKIAEGYALSPPKPILNGEPAYEQIPNNLKNDSKLDEYYVRKFAYTSLFAGACGHTYGANELWQMWKPENDPVSPVLKGPLLGADTLWSDALQYPGAKQMRHVRALMESRPFFSRIPAPEMVADADRDRVHATRDSEGSYAFAYTVSGALFTLDLRALSGETIRSAWYDPRTGEFTPFEEFRKTAERTFTPPSDGPQDDWVLVLDDAAKEYPLPGVRE
ncbi:MAG: glycoside hydrolase family 140 protein, partial [Armatimonadetes bacterium]|nr:glycoside hydrolase family 140 protein [Armatimonadota bacterium]